MYELDFNSGAEELSYTVTNLKKPSIRQRLTPKGEYYHISLYHGRCSCFE